MDEVHEVWNNALVISVRKVVDDRVGQPEHIDARPSLVDRALAEVEQRSQLLVDIEVDDRQPVRRLRNQVTPHLHAITVGTQPILVWMSGVPMLFTKHTVGWKAVSVQWQTVPSQQWQNQPSPIAVDYFFTRFAILPIRSPSPIIGL